MNSSQMALVAAGISVLLAALVLATAQRRVLARPEPRIGAYVLAWLVAVAVLGGVRTLSDSLVGNASAARAAQNFAWMAAACAFSLFVGDRALRAAHGAGGRGPPRLLLLLVLHAVVMAVVSYI